MFVQADGLVLRFFSVPLCLCGEGFEMKQLISKSAFYLLLLVIVLYTVFPFYWAIVSSLKSGSALFQVEFWPAHPQWHNYVAVFREQPFGRNILNSLFVAVSTVALSLALALAAAYALGRVQFRGRRLLLFVILGVSMFPQIAVLSGMFDLISGLGLYNNLLALSFSYLIFTLPFTVWVLTTFMRELPKELEEAAIVDGATPLTIVTRVFMPLMGPALVTTGLLAFIAAWNEFLFALTFTLSSDMRTVPVAIALISGASEHELPWGNIMAASVIVTVPLIVLVLVFQRRIVSGLTAGAIKG
jgi:trehalose/maltose transport system permease protein